MILLEHGYERLEKKIDKLSDNINASFEKVDSRFETIIDKMDKESIKG
ncbi:hypothetical protein [Candidatus Liberibacter americanus]|nr:hypothetical protein [Candidatus Liberibacter americanus]